MSALIDQVSQGIYRYIDFLWLPIAWFTVHENQRWKTIAFVMTCLISLRIQVELMEWTGYDKGFLPVFQSNVYPRGLIVYSIVIMGFLVLAHYSKKTDGFVFFAASLSIYIFAFCFSMILMAL